MNHHEPNAGCTFYGPPNSALAVVRGPQFAPLIITSEARGHRRDRRAIGEERHH
jgi:hypothetical protein